MSKPDPSRLQEVIDEQVFNYAQAAQRHYKTNDLIVILDLRDEDPELEAAPRQRFAEAEQLSPEMRQAFSKPAGDFKQVFGAPDQSFWFLAIFEDGEAIYAAINASMIGPGGSA